MIANRSVPPDAVLPHVAYHNLPDAIVWLAKTFGFMEQYRHGDPWRTYQRYQPDRDISRPGGKCHQALSGKRFQLFGALKVLTTFQSILLMLLTMVAAISFLFLLQRLWPSQLRRQHNDLIGWHISVLGSTYAVILGFMLFAVWTNFERADANAEDEANCLVNAVRSSRGLPLGQRAHILELGRQYVNVMLTEEWPAMGRRELSPASASIVRQLWATLGATEISKAAEQTSLDRTLGELARMTEYRRLRELQVDAHLPGVLWLVLLLGALVTIMSACLFGASNFRLHLIEVIMLALMISSVLIAIADINHPFQGAVHVDSAGFERARITLSDIP